MRPARQRSGPVRIALVLATATLASAQTASPPPPSHETRTRNVKAEISRLEGEVRTLQSSEEGLLGELERLGAELRLRMAQLREVELRLEKVRESIRGAQSRVDRLESSQAERERYLTFRLRGMYKAGADRELRRFLGDVEPEGYWEGLRYAAFLAERDRRVLRGYRADAVELHATRARLAGEETTLEAARAEHRAASDRVTAARSKRERRLAEIRDDRAKRELALDELNRASVELERLVEDLEGDPSARELDVRRFRGLLDWPATGQVSAGFGTVVHPRFRTQVPHPGLDIEADQGADFRTVFDGRVVFASWMRGYGLTAIVDHGNGLLSIYAHASVLLVEPGEHLLRGQSIGKVGETGSLRGPFLYFELRLDGKPADPSDWLRKRGESVAPPA